MGLHTRHLLLLCAVGCGTTEREYPTTDGGAGSAGSTGSGGSGGSGTGSAGSGTGSGGSGDSGNGGLPPSAGAAGAAGGLAGSAGLAGATNMAGAGGMAGTGGTVVDPCVGVTCDDPPSSSCKSASEFEAYDAVGSCVDGACTYTSNVISCTCAADACVTDPCADVTCNTPPDPSCPNPSTLRTYSSAGTCSDGSCSYEPADSSCPFVCSSGACTGECAPNTRRCDSGTGRPQVCSAAGLWQNEPACGANATCSGGECLCTAGTVECGDSCVQLDNDPDHCGACNHSCLGGECADGKCKPVELVAGLTQATSLAVSATHVYWMDRSSSVGNVKRVSKNGGTVQTLATDQGHPGGLALTSNQVYWGTLGSNSLGAVTRRIYRANLDGSSRTEFAPFDHTVDLVVISDNVVYWNDRDFASGTSFYSKPVGSTSGATFLGSTTEAVNNITAAGGCLYYRIGTQSISRLCPGQSAIGRFSTTSSLSFSPHQSSDATMLYFGVEDRGVMRLPLTGTAQATEVIAGAEVRGPVVDGNVLYYVDGDTGGAPACTTNWGIYRASKTPGGTRTELIPPPMDCPTSLTFDSEALYWINGTTGTIVKLAK